jgi:probable HAF family extracellular repeat protein
LGTLGGTSSVAYDINDHGSVVGSADDSLGRTRAALWGNSGPVDLGALSGGGWTAAKQINDLGQMVLWGDPLGVAYNRAAFWNGDLSSPVVALGTFGGNESWAYGLNDNGFVVGSADEANGTYHAFVWDGAGMTDLGTLGGFYSSAYAINDQGIIVGFAGDATGTYHAVEWVIPEPETLVLILFGTGFIGLWTNRRRLRGCSTRLH